MSPARLIATVKVRRCSDWRNYLLWMLHGARWKLARWPAKDLWHGDRRTEEKVTE